MLCSMAVDLFPLALHGLHCISKPTTTSSRYCFPVRFTHMHFVMWILRVCFPNLAVRYTYTCETVHHPTLELVIQVARDGSWLM